MGFWQDLQYQAWNLLCKAGLISNQKVVDYFHNIAMPLLYQWVHPAKQDSILSLISLNEPFLVRYKLVSRDSIPGQFKMDFSMPRL